MKTKPPPKTGQMGRNINSWVESDWSRTKHQRHLCQHSPGRTQHTWQTSRKPLSSDMWCVNVLPPKCWCCQIYLQGKTNYQHMTNMPSHLHWLNSDILWHFLLYFLRPNCKFGQFSVGEGFEWCEDRRKKKYFLTATSTSSSTSYKYKLILQFW